MENEELTPEEKARRVEEFFAKKRAQNEGREAVPGADQMGSVAADYVKGAVEGAVTGRLKGEGRAVKAGVGALVVDPLIGVAKLAGTPVRLLGWDGIHRLANAAEQGWANWGSDALDHGYEDWGTKLGDAGAKITEIAGMIGSFAVPGAAASKLAGMAGKAAKVYNAALPFIFGNRAAVDTYDKAIANGQSTGRALAEAAADGAINFFGFKAFASKNLNRLLKIPEMQTPYAQRFVNEGLEKGVHGFSDMVKTVRNGSLSEILLSRAKGMLKAGGIMGLQEGFSSMAKQYAAEDVRPVEEMSDEEIAAAKGQIDAWEAEQAAAEAEGRSPNTDLKPEWEKDFGDRLAVALKAGMRGMGEGAMMEGVMGAGEAALTMKEAREVTAGAIRKLIETPKGRAFLSAQNADAMGVVAGVAREGGTPTREQLDAAGLPPEMPMREVRRLAFELKRDGEMAERRAEMETEEYRKRQDLAERLAAELEEGKELEFDTPEQKAEAERALEERKERIDEARADEMVARGQGMADTLFGEEAGVLVRRGTAEERRAAAEGAVGKGADARTLKDAEGQVCGYWDRAKNEVVLFGNADAKTVAHELGWHATRQWAEKHSPELLAKMNAYAQSCPPELRAEIEAAYPDFAKNPDALLDEIGAGRFEREMGAKFGEMLERSPEAKSWWQGLKDMIAEAWRGMVRGLKGAGGEIDLKKLEAMTPEKGMEWLVGQMAEGRRLGGGENGGFDFSSRREPQRAQSGEVRYSRRVAAVEESEIEKSLDAVIGRTVTREGGKALKIKEREGEEGKIRAEAQKVFKALKDERIPLPNGGELYFAPDERTVKAYGGSVPDAWAEYCIHLVTHGVTNAETGERYRTFSEANVEKVLPEIRETVAANQVSMDRKESRIIFYRQTETGKSNNKSKFQKVVAEIDANGDVRIDLRYITGMERRGRIPGRLTTLEDALASGPTQGGATTDASSSTKSGRIPGQLTTLEDALQAGYAKSDATAARSAFDGADYSTGREAAQGGSDIRYSRKLKPTALGDGKQKYYEVKFGDAVEKIVKNKKPLSSDHVFISETPPPFKEIGIPGLPVMMNQSHVLSCYFGKGEGVKGGNMHGLGERLKSLPRALSKPMMIIANESNPSSSVIAIVKMQDKSGNTVIAPVEINGIGKSGGDQMITANIVKTAFGKKNLWSEKAASAIRDEADGKVAVFYIDATEARTIENRLASEAFNFGKTERQLLRIAKGTLHNISEKGSPVKTVGDQTSARQFKEWFDGSKVVNRNGEPRVVYHGTPNGKFWTFDKNRVGETWNADETGFFFTSDRKLAEDYTKPYFRENTADPNLFAVYLSIKKPLVIDREWWQKNYGRSDIYKHDAVEIWDNEQGTILEEMRKGGHDGVIIDPNPMGGAAKMYMVPEPTQIKSATDNIGTFDPENPDIRYQRRSAEEEIERTERALKAVREGRVRIADSGEAAGEASEPGRAASEELLNSQTLKPSNSQTFVSLPMSGLVGLYRALRSNPSLPKVLTEAKRKGAAWVSRLTKGSDVELNPEAFGIIDDTVREEVKAEMKAEGMFRNEDPVWNMKHSKRQCENERMMSEHRLEDRLNTLAQDITAGRKPGGNRVATNALAHDIGQLIMAMPMSESLRKAAGKDGTAMIRDFKTLGEGVVKAVKKGIEIEETENSRIGAEGEDRTFSQEVETVAWWRGEPMDDASIERIWKEKGEEGYLAEEAEWRRVKESLSKNPDEVAGELFGMFLAAPETLRARAPKAYERIVEAMGANETLMDAYSRIANADAPTEVMAKIEERQTSEAMRSVRQLKANLKKPLGTWWQKLKLEVARGIWSKESPAMMRIKWAAKERIGLAEEALKAAKKDGDKAEIERAKRNLETAKESAREMVEDFEHEIIMKHRNGGAGQQYMSELDSRVLGTLARAGLTLKDFDRYLKCKNVIANQGKAMDFGIVPQEAQRALDAQRSDLGEAKWKELERAAKEFHANRERNILEDANVKEMIGEMRLASWKRNSSYIRNERTLTAEEIEELNAAQFEPLTEKTKTRFRKNKETKNWELLTEPSNVARMKPVELDIETPVKKSGPESGGGNNAIRKAIEKIFGSFGKCRNAEDGEEVEFPGSSAGKMMFQSGADMSALAPHLKSLFEGATAAWYEPETRMEGHTYHPRVKGYRQYINRFSTKDGTEWYIRFTVREDKGASGRNDVHAATVSDVRLYKNAGAMIPANNTGRSSGEMPGATIPANNTGRGSGAFVDRKISHFLSGVKTERTVDVVKEMDALIKLHQTKGVMGGDRFLKPLVGSFQPTEAPTEATAMHDLSLLEYARENHYVAALADYATKMKLKGFAVVRDMRYKGVNAGERYGTRAFMKDGENFLLIMPKDVERGFAKDPEAMQFLVELNRHAAKMLTTFSARFAVRNVARNREANENNIEWMRPSMLKEVMGALGHRPEAREIELAIERAVVRLPDWVIRNPVARLVWNEKTNMHFIAEADRIGKLLFTPGELRRVSEEADRLVKDAVENGGDVEKAAAKAKRLLAECEKARQIAKLPVFAGNFLKQMGYGGKNDVEGLFDRLEGRGSEAERLPYIGKIWKGAEWWMGKVQDFNTLEEARTKIAAYLSAEWQRSAAAAKGKRWKYGDDRRISDIIAMNSGSPMGELRGAWWNALETMVTGLFGNVSMKGAVRTIESAKRAPVEWSLKAVRRAENYAMRRILYGAGGMALIIQAARRWFGDDEEAQRMLDVLEGYSKKMSRAFSMITDYRLKTYDIVPLALLGDDAVIGNCLPRGDEDKLLTPLVDYAVDAAMGTEAAKDAGLVEPLGGRYELGDLMGATFVNSGLLPDIERGGFSFKIIKDTFYSIFRNPYNLFTGRPTYDEKLWEQRGERKLEFTKEMLKQAWNDLGGQSILPLAQGPEDAEDVQDGMTAVWSATGEETTVSGGKTVFRLLHELPIGSAILSGFMFMNTKGQERITRRLLKMEEKRRAVLDHVAMLCLDCMGDNNSTGADFSQILENAREEYSIEPDEEVAIIQAVTRKLVKFARLTGKESVPMRDLLNKEITHPSRYRRIRNELTGIGWEVE